MKKFKRSERIAALVRLFCSDPGRVFTLRELSGQFGCAKSTLSEDIALLRATFSERGLGIVESINGAAGGVRFYPFYDDTSDALFIEELCKTLSHSSRILPGNLLFTADVLYEPKLLNRLGAIIAKYFCELNPDILVTLEVSGAPIALMTAKALGKPLAIARRISRPAEGPTVTINLHKSDCPRQRQLSLPTRSLNKGQRVLIIDDCIETGAAAEALFALIGEFGAEVCGFGTILAISEPKVKAVKDYVHLITLNRSEAGIKLTPAEWLVDNLSQEGYA